MKTATLDVTAIIEELRTTGQSKISLPQPVDKFCSALRRITAALAPLKVLCEEPATDTTVMVLKTERVTP